MSVAPTPGVAVPAGILNALPAHIALVDTAGRIVEVNDAWRRFATSNALQMAAFGVGANYLEVCERAAGDCAEEAPPTAHGLRQVLAGKLAEYSVEYPCHSPDQQRWFRMVATPMGPERSAGAVVMHFDVTERKLAEEALRLSEREQRELAEQLETERARLVAAQAVAKIGSWETDLVTLQVTWSEETHRIFELGPDRFRPTHDGFLAAVHPEDRTAVDAAFQRSFRQRGIHTTDHRLLLPDGRIKFLEERWQTFVGAQGRPVRALGTCQDITARKEAEASVERSRTLMRMAARLGRIGAWSVELPEFALTWSDEVCEIHEVPPGFVPKLEEAMNFYAPTYREVVAAAFQECASAGTPFDVEVQLITARGREVWVRSIGEAELDGAGAVRRVQGAFQDITERRQAAEDTVQLAERLTTTLESITDSFYTLGRDWRFTYVNHEAERVLQRPRIELLDREIWTEFPALRDSVFEHEYRRALTENKTVSFEAFYPPLKAWFAVRAYPSEQGLAVFFRDITAQREAQAAIEASERRYRLLFAGSPLPMWVFDLDTLRFLAVNEAAVRHYGYSEEEFLALDIRAVRPVEDLPAFEEHLRRSRGVGAEATRWRHCKRDGTVIDVEVRSDNIEFANYRARLVLINDVTERLRAEREAARATRALRMLSDCNEALIRANSEAELLAAICRIAVDVGGVRMAWVGYADETAGRPIVPQAHAGAEEGYLATIRVSWAEDEPTGNGPAGRAIRTGRPTVVPDVSVGGHGFVTVEEAAARGYRGVICLPLMDGARAFGVVALYLAEVRAVPAEELAVLREMADDLAFGILNQRARLERRRTHAAVLAMARGISASIGAEFFEKLTLSMVEALGAHSGFVSLLIPPGRDQARTISAVVEGRQVPNFTYDLAGTPCGQLAGSEVCVIAREARARFPAARVMTEMGIEAYVGMRLTDAAGRPIGLMFVQFQHALEQPEFIASTLRIFAARAAGELERQESDRHTREQAELIDQARDAIIVRDLGHRILFWNKGAERLYGWSAAEVVGRRMNELLKVDAAVFAGAEIAVGKTGEWNGETRKTAKSGVTLTVEGRWTLLRDEQGNPKSVLSLDTDITERKKLEQQFLRAQRMESIGTLAGGIAHDLNNLLAPIVMGVGLLQQFGLDERHLRVVQNMERSARRGADLVKQVLSFARGVEGARVAISLRHIVHEVESIAQNTFPKNITLESDLPKDLWLATGDPTQLNQVLLNLCVNARDAMPEGGLLTLTARNVVIDEQYAVMHRNTVPGRYLLLEVTDTGCGMPKEVIDRIFEPFFTTKEMGKGTGLGLSTVLGIVRSHGGFVNVYSEVGKGSVFKVHLPAQVEATGAPEAAGLTTEGPPRGRGELILVVDDEVSIRDITKQTLEAFGYRVVTAEDGAQAVGVYAMHRREVAVVLTDMMMPVMDGAALIAALQRIEPRVRVIAASGLMANGNVLRATGTGVRHFLAKPYSAVAMLSLLREVLAEEGPAEPVAPTMP